MTTLNLLSNEHGYYPSVNGIDTGGYVAAITAFQKLYLCDGRTYDNHGYNVIDFINTKITGVPNAVFDIGEVVIQDNNTDAKGIYGGCFDIKITGTVSGEFTIGELVTQATTGAMGYVAFSDSANNCIYVYPITYTLSSALEFGTGANTITGATSGETVSNPSAVTAWYVHNTDGTADTGALGLYHFIYRTGTTEFDTTNVIRGQNDTTNHYITPGTAVSEVQTCVPDATATSGTFTVTYKGETTSAIDYDATTAEIKTALETLATVDTDDITVGGTTFDAGTGGLTLTFANTLGDVSAVSFDAGNLGTTTAITVTETTKGVAIVLAPPHYYPWIPVTGVFPDGGSNIGCLCFGRIFLNSMLNPHQWVCTRVFDPLDFDTSQDDVAAAATYQNSKAGVVGDPIVAMVSYKDHYLIWGCANQTWLLQSDPNMGAVNRCISKATGMFSPTSHCWDDQNNLYFIGSDGIYKLSAEAIVQAAPPQNITKQHIPKLVSSLGLNRRTDRIAMSYDKKRYGIEISVTQQDGVWAVCFWLDLRTGGLFPDQFPTDQSPASVFYYDSYKSSERQLLMGGYDGYIRTFDEDTLTDDGSNAISSYLVMGPIVDPRYPREKIGINESSLVLGEDSDGVTVDFHRASSADELISNVLAGNTPQTTKTLSGDGLKNSIIERISDVAVAIKIKNSNSGETFSMEEINLTLIPQGRKKR